MNYEDEDWRGFAAAFNRTVRPDRRPGHSGVRVLATGFAGVVAVALGTLLTGALGGGRAIAKPSDLKPMSSPPSTGGGGTMRTGSSWTAVAGPGCASTDTSSFAAYGYYTGTNSDQTTGWSTTSSGGYSGDSCTGEYLSIPVSGQPSSYDDTRFALWRFDLSKTYTSASCTLATYVPNSSDRRLVGGDPAYYYYFQTDYGYGSTDSSIGGYLVSQVSNRGHWVVGKPFKVRTGLVTVKLVDAGARDGGAAKDAHVAAAQVQITCNAV
ncbi:hypothetical protein [Actinoallomurus soli]|uniref:hypothetical protein n=1 Tax=Actinoallomurus soli TaxID=2952535 RepID=UPI00209211AE|nr:hypothetical protein [Actinoallomurus soli]MCO5974921.1 hypothetical protein [Actinoallomurus soli]